MMVVVPFEIKHVSYQVTFSCNFLRVVVWIFHKLVAFIISTSTLVMFLPVAEAYPTELLVAYFTLHVITSLVLFDWLSTFLIRTGLSICYNPIHILTFTVVFDIPFVNHFAISWLMLFLRALEAESSSTETVNNCSWRIINLIDCVLAVGLLAPFNLLIFICERKT